MIVANLITRFLAVEIAPSDITKATVPPDERVICSKPPIAFTSLYFIQINEGLTFIIGIILSNKCWFSGFT